MYNLAVTPSTPIIANGDNMNRVVAIALESAIDERGIKGDDDYLGEGKHGWQIYHIWPTFTIIAIIEGHTVGLDLCCEAVVAYETRSPYGLMFEVLNAKNFQLDDAYGIKCENGSYIFDESEQAFADTITIESLGLNEETISHMA